MDSKFQTYLYLFRRYRILGNGVNFSHRLAWDNAFKTF